MCLYPIWGFQEGKAQPREGRGELFQSSLLPPLGEGCALTQTLQAGIQVKHSGHLGWVRACFPALARVLPLEELSHTYSPVPQPPQS